MALLVHSLRIHVQSPQDLVTARRQARHMAEAIGLRLLDCTTLVAAVSELARNVLVFAKEGDVEMSVSENGTARGIRVEVSDRGPGIPDVPLAMRDGYSSCGGLGMGLPGTRRLMDEFHIASMPGGGTRVTVVKWLRPE